MGRTRRVPVLADPGILMTLEPLIQWSQLFYRSIYDELIDVRNELNKEQIIYTTTPPILGDMKVGEVAIGNGSESSPSAGSHAIYFKPNDTQIVVLSTDGTLISISYIGTQPSSSSVTTLTDTKELIKELVLWTDLLNQHLQLITGCELQLGETLS